jgi:hypothetical protein
LCAILAEILETEVVTRRFALGHLATVGTVANVYKKGFVVVVNAKPTQVRIGDQVAIVSKRKLVLSHIVSIQDFDKDVDAIVPEEGQEIGLGLDRRCGLGYTLAKVTPLSEYEIDLTPAPEPCAEEPTDETESDSLFDGVQNGSGQVGDGGDG